MSSGKRGPIRTMHASKCRPAKYAVKVPPAIITCRECHSVVVTGGVGRRRFYCSNTCADNFTDRIRRAEEAGATVVDTPGLADVAYRWGWMCGICGWSVDRGLRFPDWWSPQVDHIVPLSLGGVHGIANLQLAHRYCNTAKGARTQPDFFLLRDLKDLLDARTAA